MRRLSAVAVLCLAAFLGAARCGEERRALASDAPQLKAGDYVAVSGDSITEQRLYSHYIEAYLLMCKPAPDLRVTQFGWGGETAGGFARRMENDVLRFKPAVATTCYGMNDGGSAPMTEGKGKGYHDAQKEIVEKMKKAGVRFIVVGSPGVVDADMFHKKPADAEMYNKTLAALRDIAKQVAEEEKVVFANVYDPMLDVMTKAKAKFGKAYHVGGSDGVHPDCNGHLVMAYAFLKALGCKGDIGTITVNVAENKAEATDGHKVLSCKDGTVEIESSRYPFCFYGDPTKTSSTRSVLEFLPFNEELNRFKLVVTGAGDGKVKVTWGTAAKEYPAADIAKGINLAAEFDDNPFSSPFKQVEIKISNQQNMEVTLVKTLIHGLPEYKKFLPDDAETVERLGAALVKKDQVARDESAASVGAVKHTLKIEAVR